eukprot:gene9275-10878_t
MKESGQIKKKVGVSKHMLRIRVLESAERFSSDCASVPFASIRTHILDIVTAQLRRQEDPRPLKEQRSSQFNFFIMYYQPQVAYAVAPMSFSFAPPQAFQGFWYASLYSQIQQYQLMELQTWFMSMDRNRSGHITNVELQYLVIGGTPLGIDTASKLIKVFDSNKNGAIDFYEYAALHQFVNLLHRCFVANDRNYSGTIDAQEIHMALATAGFQLPFHTVNLYFLKVSPTGMGILFTQYLGICASIALTRSLFEWNDPMRTGVVHLTMAQLYDMFALC